MIFSPSFTMDLVLKDVGLFCEIAKRQGLDLELGPQLCDIFRDGQKRYGDRALSPMIWRRMEEQTGSLKL
jgi:3-hydroxyisobutyrate dehydrogenase